MDFLIIIDGRLRKTSELQAALAFQTVGVRLAPERGEAVLYKLFWVVESDPLLDVHMCCGTGLDGRCFERDKRDLAVRQVQRSVERGKVGVVLGVRGLGGVDHETKLVWSGILDSIGVDRELCFVHGLLGEFGVADVDSDASLLSAGDCITVKDGNRTLGQRLRPL